MEKDIITYHRYHDSRGRSYHGTDQVAISAKIDSDNMTAMDAEMYASGVKRNRLINLAIKWYLEELDNARREVCEGGHLGKYILNVDTSDLPTGELERLDHICKGFGCTKERFALHALGLALRDYDSNPYRYLP